MGMSPFISRFPGLGEQETRVATILEDDDLPAGEYAFLELYCDEPGCDCRRVVIQVVERSSRKKIWATMNYGWEKPGYYVKWMGSASLAEEAAGLTLDPLFPQTEYAPALVSALRGDPRRPCLCGTAEAPLRDVQGIEPPRSSDWESHDRSGRANATQAGAQEVEAAAMRRPDSHAAAPGALPRGGDRGLGW